MAAGVDCPISSGANIDFIWYLFLLAIIAASAF
jgi:hypothetical protein